MKKLTDILSRVVDFGALAIVVLAPSQISLKISKAWLSPVDPLVWLTAVAWLTSVVLNRRWRDFRLPPLAAWVFVGLAVISAATTSFSPKSGKEIFKFIEYFIAAYVVLASVTSAPGRLRRVADLFLGMATVVIAIGAAQYLMPKVPDFLVRATFGNRNVLGGYLSMALPLAAGLLFYDTSRIRKAWYLVILVTGLAIILSGASLLAIAVACVAVAAVRSSRAAVVTAALLAVFATVVVPALPRQKNGVLMNSVRIYNDDAQPSNRYPEWDAALHLIGDKPWFGVGPGRYQDNIGTYFGSLPDAPSEKAEADSENLYLVTAASMGVFGLAAFAALLCGFGARAVRAWASATDPWTRGLAIGLAGSLIGYAINSIWSPMLVRGIGIPLVVLFAMIHGLGSQAPSADRSS